MLKCLKKYLLVDKLESELSLLLEERKYWSKLVSRTGKPSKFAVSKLITIRRNRIAISNALRKISNL